MDNRIHWDSFSRKGFIKDNRQLAESSGSRHNTAYLGWASRNESQKHNTDWLPMELLLLPSQKAPESSRRDHPSSWLQTRDISALIYAGQIGTPCPLHSPRMTHRSDLITEVISSEERKITSRICAVRECGLLIVQHLDIREGDEIYSKLANTPN